MSTEATIIKLLKKNNIAEQALQQLTQFAADIKLNVLLKFIDPTVPQNPEQKISDHQKKTATALLDALKHEPEYGSDWALINANHNRRVANLFDPDRKQIVERSKYEHLVTDAVGTIHQHIGTCIKDIKPIALEINYFYILYHLRDQLLNYWDIRNRVLFEGTNKFNANLTSLYSQNLQIQMLLDGLKKILPPNDALEKILTVIGFDFFNEEMNTLQKSIQICQIKVGALEAHSEKFKAQQTAVYPSGAITNSKEYEAYKAALAAKKLGGTSSIRLSYFKRLGICQSPITPKESTKAKVTKPNNEPANATNNPSPSTRQNKANTM